MNAIEQTQNDKAECACCGARQAHLTVEHASFEYGDRGASTTLVADIPIWECAACGERYTAEGAEDAERAAICAYLGRLTPAEILSLRRASGLTQDAFASQLGVGRVTLARWETGQQMQSAVYDRLIRGLAGASDRTRNARRTPTFMTDVSHRRLAAEHFRLVA